MFFLSNNTRLRTFKTFGCYIPVVIFSWVSQLLLASYSVEYYCKLGRAVALVMILAMMTFDFDNTLRENTPTSLLNASRGNIGEASELYWCACCCCIVSISCIIEFLVGGQSLFAPFETEKSIHLIFSSHPFPFCGEVLEILQEIKS